MVKKTAVFLDKETNSKITVIKNEDKSINFDIGNAIGLLRLISNAVGFEYDPSWNTQYFGQMLIGTLNDANQTEESNTAVFTDKETNSKITIIKNEDKSISFEIGNAKGLLRLISNAIGFEYDPNWNTQHFGQMLIDALNNPNPVKKTVEKEDTPNKFYRWYEVGMTEDESNSGDDETFLKYGFQDPDEAHSISNEAWNWWVGLEEDIKYLLLFQLHDIEDDIDMPYCEGGGNLYLDEDYDEVADFTTDEIRDVLSSYLEELATLDRVDVGYVEQAGNNYNGCSIDYYFDKLSYLPCLEEMSFEGSSFCTFFPKSLITLKQLKKLNLRKTSMYSGDINESLENLFEFAKSHPNMAYLNICRSGLDDALLGKNFESSKYFGKLNELQALMPNCVIEV